MNKSQGKTLSTSLPLSCFVYGAGQENDGVCLLLQVGKYRVLLDCGLKNIQDLLQKDQLLIDFVFCSHAHADHCSGLLALHQAFPKLPIYTSDVTAKLLPCHWMNQDSTANLDWCLATPWRSPINIAPDLQIELVPAGHYNC